MAASSLRTIRRVLIGLALCLVGLLALGWQEVVADGPLVHVVSYGETLTSLSRKYSVPLSTLLSLNRLGRSGWIYAGQRLLIPTKDNSPSVPGATAMSIRLGDVPRYRQQQTLTCEEAAVVMAMRGRVSEAQLVRAMPRSANPFEGIRGRTNAPIWGSLSDYGVYAQAMQLGLQNLGISSRVLYRQPYDAFKAAIIAELKAGRPVVWWTTYRQQWQTPVHVELPGGNSVKLVRFEHTVTIVGLSAGGFLYHDPYDATVRTVSFADHQRVSSYFDDMALIVE